MVKLNNGCNTRYLCEDVSGDIVASLNHKSSVEFKKHFTQTEIDELIKFVPVEELK